ncbi:MAG TPA: transketolase [Candidatus Hydrogenedentes bacterium]|nr:transketolase [Candidatus Hydrogenedentota bacterium]HPG65593.1 transketolase [Candidatus Hydrogenedentota bacterium]
MAERPAHPPALDARSYALRRRIVEVLDAARRGHVGAAFSLVEILRVLYDDVLKYRPDQPDWPDRDRCILSKGHGCLALYAILADHNFFSEAELMTFCRRDTILGGHPDARKTPGVETSTGSLGHGLAVGVGMALAARMRHRPNRVFVVLGDGECDEGAVWEAALCASKHALANLTAIVDYNKMQSYGPTRLVQDLEPFMDKWRSFGFAVDQVDGHDVEALRETFARLPFHAGKPSAIIGHTVKGKGAAPVEHNAAWHHKSKLSDADVDMLKRAIEEYGCDRPA